MADFYQTTGQYQAPYETNYNKLFQAHPITGALTMGVAPLVQKAAGWLGNVGSAMVSSNINDPKNPLPMVAGRAQQTANDLSGYTNGTEGKLTKSALSPPQTTTTTPNQFSGLSMLAAHGPGVAPPKPQQPAAPAVAKPAPKAKGPKAPSQATPSAPTAPLGPMADAADRIYEYQDPNMPGPVNTHIYNPDERPATNGVSNDVVRNYPIGNNGGIATMGGHTFVLPQRSAEEDARWDSAERTKGPLNAYGRPLEEARPISQQMQDNYGDQLKWEAQNNGAGGVGNGPVTLGDLGRMRMAKSQATINNLNSESKYRDVLGTTALGQLGINKFTAGSEANLRSAQGEELHAKAYEIATKTPEEILHWHNADSIEREKMALERGMAPARYAQLMGEAELLKANAGKAAEETKWEGVKAQAPYIKTNPVLGVFEHYTQNPMMFQQMYPDNPEKARMAQNWLLANVMASIQTNQGGSTPAGPAIPNMPKR